MLSSNYDVIFHFSPIRMRWGRCHDCSCFIWWSWFCVRSFWFITPFIPSVIFPSIGIVEFVFIIIMIVFMWFYYRLPIIHNVERRSCWDYLLPTLYMSIQLYKLRFIQNIYDKYEYMICINVFPLIIYRYMLLCISTYGMLIWIIIFIFSLFFILQRLIISNS